MNDTIRKILIKEGFNLDEYTYVDKSCTNIILIHKKTKKRVDVRW